MFACRGGHAPAFLLLLEAGADPLAFTSKGSTPLHFAASAGCSPVRLGIGVDADSPVSSTFLLTVLSTVLLLFSCLVVVRGLGVYSWGDTTRSASTTRGDGAAAAEQRSLLRRPPLLTLVSIGWPLVRSLYHAFGCVIHADSAAAA